MPAYAYPIIIRREPQKVRYTREIELNNDGVLTLATLRTLVTEDESFSVMEKENSMFGSTSYLIVSGERLETDEELKARIEQQEKYMAEYNRRHPEV